MSTLVLSLLPSQRESLQDLQARYAKLVACLTQGVAYDGIPVHRNDPNIQTVMKALVAAIARRKEESRKTQPDRRVFSYRKQQRKTGKTDKDRKKEGYVSPDERKRQKAERSREIRQKMRSTKKE